MVQSSSLDRVMDARDHFKNEASSEKIMLKKITTAILITFFAWYTLNLTGFSIGSFVLVISCFVDEPIDFVGWIIFLIGLILFIWKNNIGKYFIAIWLMFLAYIQIAIYLRTPERMESYYNHFANHGTHRLFPVSANFIKDTYHIFIDFFILISLVCVICFIIMEFRKNRAKKTRKFL